ncbi:MAG: glycoside hydrolase family 97 C-terminal domain-containing protein [Bacteroidales bacterium]
MALYVVYESPLQMMADSPSNYMREQECTDFISAVPTVWDETVVLDGRIGEYISIARRKGNTWYLAVLGGRDAREMSVDLKFLGESEYSATVFSDGINSDRYAGDYTRREETFTGGGVLKVRLAPGGGWAARIEKKSGQKRV